MALPKKRFKKAVFYTSKTDFSVSVFEISGKMKIWNVFKILFDNFASSYINCSLIVIDILSFKVDAFNKNSLLHYVESFLFEILWFLYLIFLIDAFLFCLWFCDSKDANIYIIREMYLKPDRPKTGQTT